jgi:hypothetical protein
MFFQPLQNANMRQAQRAAAFQSHADGRAAGRLNARQRRAGWRGRSLRNSSQNE